MWKIVVLPPADMAAALQAGQIDGFCAGAPWGAVAAWKHVGRAVAVTSDVWRNHPEKCLALNGGWAAAHPDAVLGLLRALLRAGQECDEVDSSPALATLLAKPAWVGVAAPLIAASLPGGAGREVDQSVFSASQAGVPFRAHARWFVQQMARWRKLPAKAGEVGTTLYRPELYDAAAKTLG